jgi:hypothetical protein
MTYTVRTLNQPSYDNFDASNPLARFCMEAQAESDNDAVENVRYDDWDTNRSSLLYAISQGRFDEPNGTFQAVVVEDRFVSVAGAYLSDFDSNAVMVGCRAWTLPDHRTRFLIGDLILPIQLDWAVAHGADVAMFSFVPYNTWLAKMILRASAGRALRPGQQNSAAYQGWVAHPTLCMVKNVNQIILYKQLGIEERVPDFEGIDTKLPNGLD